MKVIQIDNSTIIEGLSLTAIGMGTAFILLLILISSIYLTRIISNKINPIPIPPTLEEIEELNRKARAAAVAVAVLKNQVTDTE